jgi:polysaccharide biosynthesis protein PslH
MPAPVSHGGEARPRLLFVSCHLPWPAISGGRRRELELIERISDRFDVHLLVISKTPEQDQANAAALRRHCRIVEVYSAGAGAGLPGWLDGEDAPKVRLHRCDAAGWRIAQILARGEVDLIHVEGFYLMQHVPEWTPAPLLLVEQNVEYELERQRAETTDDAAARRRFARTRAVEQDCWTRATRLAAVTAEDADTIERALTDSTVEVVPDGADHLPNLRVLESDQRLARPDAPLLVLLANFAYAPNVDAAGYLCEQILPRIRRRVPNVTLWLVGNAPPDEVRARHCERIAVTGTVSDVLPYLDVADVVVCPLRIGGGIKVKTIEALRRGKAIVSTSVGAQGLHGAARDAIVVVDDPDRFAAETVRLLLDTGRRAQLESRAIRAAAQLPSWDDAARTLTGIYDDVLAQAPRWTGHVIPRAMAGVAR